jgi:hypothetical protein
MAKQVGDGKANLKSALRADVEPEARRYNKWTPSLVLGELDEAGGA